MGYHNLLSKADRTMVAYLISAGAGTSADVFHHKRADDIPSAPPYTTCFAENAKETRPYSGNYTVRMSIDVHTNAAPDKDQNTETMQLDSDERVSATFDALHDRYDQCGDRLADLITAAKGAAGVSDFTIDDVLISEISQGRGERDGEWIDSIELELVCRTS